MSSNPPDPVLVVGGGPVGLTVANLLAARAVPVVLVERNDTTSDEAKAISLDGESLRVLAAADLADAVLEIVVPGTGTRYFDRHGKLLFHARGPRDRSSYPFKNQFAQPELERVLLDALKSRSGADVRFSTELIDLSADGDRVAATIRTTGDDATSTLTASWVLACDGGRSRVRDLRSIAMIGVSHSEPWLVVDTVDDHHDQRYGLHLGTPERPTVVIPGRGGRCRYEFLLRPDEGDKTTPPTFDTVRRLVSPFRAIREDQVERQVVYTFNAVVADRWRDGRCLLLGDAAHMMPPFAGQGLNSGIRDAANVAWKVAEVWRGQAGLALLDTYEQERRPHVEASVRFSERLGEVVMTTDRWRALARDVVVKAMMSLPVGRRYLTEMRFRPVPRHREGVVIPGHPLAGRPLPQPEALLAPHLVRRPLDAALGDEWAALGVEVTEEDWRLFRDTWAECTAPVRLIDVVLHDRLPRATADRHAVADADGCLDALLGSASGRIVVVKPDRYVAGVVGPGELPGLAAVLRRYMTPSAQAPSGMAGSREPDAADGT